MITAVETQMTQWIDELQDSYISTLYKALPAGKRLRAKLVLVIAKEHENAVKLASVIELIHAASLLHDDVIDEASLRRGKPSVNATQGSKTAVMVGDILYSKAYAELALLGSDIAHIVAASVTQLSMGEIVDVELAKTFNHDDTKYLDMIYKKTASLIEATTQTAAILAGLDTKGYALYGKNLGLAFQIIDDILDITSTQETMGKPVLNDYVEGKVTLPYIYLYEKSSNKEKLLSLHAKALSTQDSDWLLKELTTHKTISQSYALAQKLSDEAMQSVEIPELKAILIQLMKREY